MPLEHIASVGRLDYNSEGLMILTNNGDLARQLELPENEIMRTYKVRVFGRLDEEKLGRIREGCVIGGI
jgi:23S rRNA pseudouridine2605 synthase